MKYGATSRLEGHGYACCMKLLGALLILFPSIVHAGPARPARVSKAVEATKSKNLMTWVNFAMTKGKAAPLTFPLAGNLGYERGLESRRLIGLDKKSNRDLVVAVRVVEGKASPLDIVGCIGKYVEAEGKKYFDGYFFRWSFEGKLLSAVKAEGLRGSIVQTKLDIASDEVKKMSASELEYYYRNPPPVSK